MSIAMINASVGGSLSVACGRTDAEREVEVGRLSYRVSRLEAS